MTAPRDSVMQGRLQAPDAPLDVHNTPNTPATPQ